MSYQSWTFEPLEIEQCTTWEIYDPNTAELVAVFHDFEEAQAFLRWRNKKQAKRQAEKDRRKQSFAALHDNLRESW